MNEETPERPKSQFIVSAVNNAFANGLAPAAIEEVFRRLNIRVAISDGKINATAREWEKAIKLSDELCGAIGKAVCRSQPPPPSAVVCNPGLPESPPVEKERKWSLLLLIVGGLLVPIGVSLQLFALAITGVLLACIAAIWVMGAWTYTVKTPPPHPLSSIWRKSAWAVQQGEHSGIGIACRGIGIVLLIMLTIASRDYPHGLLLFGTLTVMLIANAFGYRNR